MRVLAAMEGGGAATPRLAPAAAALAMRGHEVAWMGPQAPDHPIEGLHLLARGRELRALASDVVVSDAAVPWKATLRGWQARAFCQVMALERRRVAAWGPLQHAMWSSLHPFGLIEPGEAEAFLADPMGLEVDRLALWSDEPPPLAPDPAHPDAEILERACSRALARQRARAPRPAVFLDRDGTLVREVGYLADPSDLELLPHVPAALRALQAAGFALVVISNQSGVGRGLFPISSVHEAMARLRRRLRDASVELDGIYFCPHRPDAGCACRKPGSALIERAEDDLNLAARGSFLVGDKRLDVETAHRVGARGILVRTGYGRDEETREGSAADRPDAVCDDLEQATAWILAHTPNP